MRHSANHIFDDALRIACWTHHKQRQSILQPVKNLHAVRCSKLSNTSASRFWRNSCLPSGRTPLLVAVREISEIYHAVGLTDACVCGARDCFTTGRERAGSACCTGLPVRSPVRQYEFPPELRFARRFRQCQCCVERGHCEQSRNRWLPRWMQRDHPRISSS